MNHNLMYDPNPAGLVRVLENQTARDYTYGELGFKVIVKEL